METIASSIRQKGDACITEASFAILISVQSVVYLYS